MPNGFPCPNPACTHVFAPDSIKGVAAVNCPRCHTVFQFRAAASPMKLSAFPPSSRPVASVPPPPPPPVSSKTTPPMLRPAAPPPVAPAAPSLDFDAPVALPARTLPTSTLAFDEPTRRTSSRKKPTRRRGNGRLLVGSIVFLLLAGAVVGAYFYFPEYFTFGDDSRRGIKTKANFSITVPSKWRPDDALLSKFRANIAVTRSKPRGHFVLRYRDYQRRLPSDVEMFDSALNRLRSYFPKLEYVNPFDQANKGRSELGGEQALSFTFSAADSTEVPLRGECHMLARQGFAYWLFFWGPEELQEPLADQFASVRANFKLYDDREGWKPRPPETEVVRAERIALQANFVKEVWKNETNTKDTDGSVEMLLRGIEPTEEDAGPSRSVPLGSNAPELVVLLLPRTGDSGLAMKSAQDYIRKRAEATLDAKLDPVLDPNGKAGSGKQVGAYSGQVDRYRLLLGAENEKFVLVGVARRPEGVLIVYGECKWDRRDYWEQEFRRFMATVRPAPKGP